MNHSQLVREDSVHAAAYTDADVFNAEMERIFHQGWVYVAHESEVPKPGDHRLRYLGRQSVVVIRGSDMRVRVLLNRCRHRGAMVCLEDGSSRFLRCNYHGWTYRDTGEIAGIPFSEGYGPELDAVRERGLEEVARVSEYRGFLFASLARHGLTLDEHLGAAKSEIDMFVDLSPSGRIDAGSGCNKSRYRGNWKLQLENSMDGYHPTIVHQAAFDILRKRTGGDSFKNRTGDWHAQSVALGGGHVLLDARELKREEPDFMVAFIDQAPWGEEYRQAMREGHGEEYAELLLRFPGWSGGSTHLLVWPNLMLLSEEIRVVRPVAVDLSEVYRYPALLCDVPAELNERRMRAHDDFYSPAGAVSPDDEEMMARIQASLAGGQGDPWLLMSRGMHDERIGEDGTVRGAMSSETGMRGIWRHWRDVMACAKPEMDAASQARALSATPASDAGASRE